MFFPRMLGFPGSNMLKQKRIYITLSALLLAGLAIVAGVLLIPALRIPLNAKIRAALSPHQVDGALSGLPDGSSLNPGYSSSSAGNYRKANYSFVMDLIKTSTTKELFGSYRVKGIIRDSASPQSSRAIIEDLNAGKTHAYATNENLPDGSQIVDIERDHISLQKNGVRKKLYVFSRHFGENIQHGTLLENVYLGYKKLGDNEFALKPYQVFKGDANSILDFSIKVSAVNGQMEGVRITDIKDNVLARELGLKEDDVLLEVNNEAINSLYKCFQVSFNANNSDELQLKIRRGDNCIFLTYHLYWEGIGFWTPKDVLNSKAIASLLDFDFAAHLF
jgi:type II secretory pathway component PulC